jgi:hypothetical protein
MRGGGWTAGGEACSFALGPAQRHDSVHEMKTVFRRKYFVTVAGFLVSLGFALHEDWSYQSLCWSLWVAGLVYCWAFGFVGALRTFLLVAQPLPPRWFPGTPSPWLWRCLVAAIGCGLGIAAFYGYSYAYGFYGIFLSVFAEMTPPELFGRNGFINSDFYTPVVWLLERYWPMVLGTVVADLPAAFVGEPTQVAFKPLNRQLVMMHVITIGLPFVLLLLWPLMGDRYTQGAVIVVLVLFHFFPRKGAEPVNPGRA